MFTLLLFTVTITHAKIRYVVSPVRRLTPSDVRVTAKEISLFFV